MPPEWPHRRVAFLPWLPITLKVLKSQDLQVDPQTLGEHLKRARLDRRLSQKEVARLLGVDSFTLLNWEKDLSQPLMRAMPAILQFLRYDPFPEPVTLSERMRAKRREMGWTIEEAAQQLGVDERTWGSWERTGRIRWTRYRKILEDFLDARNPQGQLSGKTRSV